MYGLKRKMTKCGCSIYQKDKMIVRTIWWTKTKSREQTNELIDMIMQWRWERKGIEETREHVVMTEREVEKVLGGD